MGVDFKLGKVTPFLLFQGNAEKAMNFYTSLIEDSKSSVSLVIGQTK
jgi:predicted 3-demethylubiquinone-9 3-methyltransferase (glyoxalase superfamily)